ncbi:hypothetical protein V1512DRAFT_277504 [Lipomyces arxii]|uniref:uncharacterized protein n=1 Tax=Lipomyces arxii TaxID=56418 RepID=UPI0034CFCD38
MSKPLEGFNICCTGVPSIKINELKAKTQKMGGRLSLDLLSSVTHLVVASPDTPKYEYALKKRPDIMFLTVEFVPVLYDKWISGEDIDVDHEIAEYGERTVFGNIKIAFTNIPGQERLEYASLVKKHGGVYIAYVSTSADLLVAGKGEGEKYKFALDKKIPIVHVNWLKACLKRGAWISSAEFSFDLGEQAVEDRLARIPSKQKPVLALTDKSLSEKRPVSLVRRTRSENTWNAIMEDIESSRPPSRSASVVVRQSSSHGTPFDLVDADEANQIANKGIDVTEESAEERLFSGHIFLFHGFSITKLKYVEQYITSRGGIILSSEEESQPTHFVVPFDAKPLDLRPTPPSAVLVTNWYIDESIHYQQLQPPETCVYSRYLGEIIHHPNASIFQNKQISASGFSGMQATHIERFITALGAKFIDTLEESRDLLVVTDEQFQAMNNRNMAAELQMQPTKKMRAAVSWKIRIAPAAWIFEPDRWASLFRPKAAAEDHERAAKRARESEKENIAKITKKRQH